MYNLGDVSETVQQFVRDVGAYSIAGIAPAIFSVIALTIFTRLFSPSAFGRYSIAISVGGIGSTLLFGWLNKSIIRFGSKVDERKLIGTAFAVVIGISLCLITVAGGVYALIGNTLGPYQPFYAAALAFLLMQGAFQPIIALFRATLNSKLVTVFMCIKAVAMLAFSVLIVLFVYDHISGWIWGNVIAIVISILAVAALSDLLRTVPQINRDMLVRMSGYGLPLIGWIMGDPLLNQADRFLIEFLRGSATVGIYTSNYSLADRGLRLAMIPLLDAIQPIVIDRWNGDNQERIEELLSLFTKYFFVLAVPALVLLGALSRPLSTLLLGEAYHEGYVVIPIVGAGVFMWSLGNLGQIGLEIRERTALMSRGLIAAVVFNILVNIPLIMSFGYVGAAFGTLLSYSAYAAFVFWYSRDRIVWHLPTETIGNVMLAGTVMAAFPALLYVSDWYTHGLVVVAGVVSTVVYVSILYVSGEITDENITRIRELT
ncbi:oligosaccharide flippase family protein [Haloarcula sp. S1AR25-5A]|uniref:Oligosaccharide flippase family protein n=1 Tax=Haloarcula terrestris TaxID=2950533 RepID=A0AAE4F0C2_9EURY|nr:oligosaccharide flippase family protein [Haloarcula terrestris]MDS0222704.1 oligosaccharide flippase family protein [Haloarcula terrestris]